MTTDFGGWIIIREDYKAAHLIPDGDLMVHILTDKCPCNPEYDEECNLWVHNSADGREDFEEGRRKVS